VDDGNDSWFSNIDGAPFPQEQLTRIIPIRVAAILGSSQTSLWYSS
jgi:hypothetical protein